MNVVHIRFVAFSQRGVGKAHNEDAVMLDGRVLQGTVREQGAFDTQQPRYFAVADGVSIGTRPRTASRRLLELLQSRLATATISEHLVHLLRLVQRDYVALAANATLAGMASTLVGVRLLGNVATIFNVGDSRAYLLAGGMVRLLSRDHNLLNDLLDDGEIIPEQAENAASIMRGLTCQFIADEEFDDFNVFSVTHVLQPGERLLLCSDGLNETLSDSDIAALLAENIETDLQLAYKAARQHGGRDDFSVVVLTPA